MEIYESSNYRGRIKTSIVVRKSSLIEFFYVLLFIIQLKPGYFNYVDTLDMIFNAGRVISGFVILFLYVHHGSKLKLPLVILGLLFTTMIISTFINGFSVIGPLIKLASLFCILLLADYLISKNPYRGINILAKTFEILLYANFLTVLLFPGGVYETELHPFGGSRVSFFLDYQTTMIYHIVIGISFLLILYYMKPTLGNRLRVLTYFIIMFIQNILAWSATPLMLCFFIALCFLYFTLRPKTQIFTCKIAVVTMAVELYACVILRLQEKFSWLIVDILHRSLTFSNRTPLWDIILYLFPQQPLLGYGIRDSVDFPILLGGNIHYIHGHNQMLDILLKSGIIGIALFVVLLVVFAFKVDKIKDNYSRSILCVMIPLLVTSCLTEPPFTIFISTNIIFIIGFRLEDIRNYHSPYKMEGILPHVKQVPK